MIKFVKFSILALAVSAVVMGFAGCKKEDTAGQTDQLIDKAVDAAQQEAEKAGEQVKDAVKK